MASQDSNPNPTRHIAVLAFPFGTHAAPLLCLTEALSAALGSGTTFSFLTTYRANRALFRDRGAGGSKRVTPFDVGDGLPEGYTPSGNPVEVVDMFVRSAPANFRGALAAAERKVGLRAGCVVSDAFFWFAGEFAAERGVPWVTLWTAAPRSLLAHLAADEIRRRGIEAEEGILSKDRILDFLPGFSCIRGSDIPEGVLMNDSPFADMLHKMGQSLPDATVVVMNSFHKIDPEISDHLKTRLRNFLNIGPFVLTMKPNLGSSTTVDEHGCLEWLSKHKPASVVYISFGSVVTLPPHEVKAIAEALEETGFPFLWSFRGTKPEGFLEDPDLDGKLTPWAPQVEVLKHPSVGAFVTHCGWNSVLESVVGGVPLICRPFFGDQKLNSRTVEAVWRVGIGLDEEGVLTKKSVVKALRRVLLDDEEGKGMRERVSVLKRLAYEAVDKEDINALVMLIV